MPRDHVFEREVLELAVKLCEQQHTSTVWNYFRHVKLRLELGAEVYGDDDFLNKDGAAEALEECPDIGGYLVLDLQRIKPKCTPDAFALLQMAAVKAIVGAVAATGDVQAYQALRDEYLDG